MAKKRQTSDDPLGLSGMKAARMAMEEREAYKVSDEFYLFILLQHLLIQASD